MVDPDVPACRSFALLMSSPPPSLASRERLLAAAVGPQAPLSHPPGGQRVCLDPLASIPDPPGQTHLCAGLAELDLTGRQPPRSTATATVPVSAESEGQS